MSSRGLQEMSSRRLQDMSSRRLEDAFRGTIFRHPRRLQDISQDTLKTYLEDVFKTCIEDVLKICLEDVLKTCLEDVCKTSWRQTKCFLKLSASNKSKCGSNKSGISQMYT